MNLRNLLFDFGTDQDLHAASFVNITMPPLTATARTIPIAGASSIPVELLREIFLYTPPTALRDIIWLAGVTSLWRSVVISLPELHTHANWDHWPLDALVEWTQRGKSAGLHVVLGQQAVRRAVISMNDTNSKSFNEMAAEEEAEERGTERGYIRLLDATSPFWHALSMEFDRGEDEMAHVHRLLLRWEAPHLRVLHLIDLEDEGQHEVFTTHPNLAPRLEEFMCKDVHVIRSTPWQHLKRVVINVDFWDQGIEGIQVFKTFSQAETLTLDSCGFSGVGDENITLDGMREVTIVDDSITGFAEWPLRHISFPRVSKLTLRGTRPYSTEFPAADKRIWVSIPSFSFRRGLSTWLGTRNTRTITHRPNLHISHRHRIC